ncbi:MAG TPA: spore coat protein [Clostridiales bacterium]|nr:spore coat protein [Clostridiales bacterium]
MDITLSQKERLLLEDLKSQEQLCIEKYTAYANQAQDVQLKQILSANGQVERSHLNSVNQLLNGQIPQMNQQQNQGNAGQAMGNQSTNTNMNNAQNMNNFSDKSICSDLLGTEKYVSGTYDTAIFEFRDTGVRDVLNHIQKEEQKHGEAIFQYMENKGMYQVH